MTTADNRADESDRQHNSLGHLASAVGHHVINAFSAVVSNAEMLRLRGETIDPADITSLSEAIVQTALEASTVARRLIDFTRPITNVGTSTVLLDQLVRTFVESQPPEGSAGLRWDLNLNPVPAIIGNPEHLRRMLELLKANSLEARRDGVIPTITLTSGLDVRGWVMLEWIDNGVGMSPQILERAVEPFFTTRSGQLGVGLSIANGIWRRHRGTMSIRSRPGEGTAIRLCVEPLTQGDLGSNLTPIPRV